MGRAGATTERDGKVYALGFLLSCHDIEEGTFEAIDADCVYGMIMCEEPDCVGQDVVLVQCTEYSREFNGSPAA